MTNFRWFTDDKTERVRTAKQSRDVAQRNLNEYSDHHYETHPRSHYDTPEYYRLNRITWDACGEVKRARGW